MTTSQPHVVIIGGGFAGLEAAKALGNQPVQVTLIDKRNFHLFQPLLYQVATGGLSESDIASPLRAVLDKYQNIRVLMGEVTDIDPVNKTLHTKQNTQINFDTLIVATGSQPHYFGHDDWADKAPGLKTVENALDMRSRIFHAFEAAEQETDPEKQKTWQTFIIVGGGPTGVELAGSLAELACSTLVNDFRNITPSNSRIILVEGADRILPPYPPDLSAKAQATLERLGIEVQTSTMIIGIHEDHVTLRHQTPSAEIPTESTLDAKTILWGAGMTSSPLGKLLAEKTGAELDRAGRVMVNPDFSVSKYPDIFVLGDLAHYTHNSSDDKTPLPALAPVAMQQGTYIARLIKSRLYNKPAPVFKYRDKGTMSVIGRNAAVADLWGIHLDGWPAWMLWAFVHIRYLVEFDNQLLVLTQWAWNYCTRNRSARLITHKVD